MHLLFLLLFLIGCHSPSKVSLLQTLKISFAQNPSTMDPRKSSDYSSSTLICLLFEGLMRCDAQNELKFGLAEKVEISKDEKTYLFTLRNAFWSDGRKVTAKDFEQSWKAILTPGFPAPCAYLLYPIKNGERYAKGLCSAKEVGIYALNDHTLKVELERKTPYFLSLTAFPLYLPSPSHVDTNAKKIDEPFICNGPFTIEKIKLGEEIVLKKNSTFWNPKEIHLDKILIQIIANESIALHLFEKGELDLVGGPFSPLPLDFLPKIKEDIPLHFLPMAASTFCVFNTKSFPFSNKTLRKAFALSVKSHPMIAQEIDVMGQIKAVHLLPPSLRENFTTMSKTSQENPLALLHQAMQEIHVTPQDLNALTLYYRTSPTEKKIAEILQKIWEETLGIQVRLEQIDAKSLMQKLYAKNHQLSLASWIAQFHDPINILERFKEEKNSKNYSGWSDLEYNHLLNEIASEQNDSHRFQLLARAEEMIEDEFLCISLYHWNSPLLINPRVKGLAITNSGGILIEQSFIEPESSSQRH